MRFLKENVWTLATLFLAIFLGMTGSAWAQGTSPTGSTIVQTATSKVGSVFKSVKTIIFVIAGFGLVGLAWAAIFKKGQQRELLLNMQPVLKKHQAILKPHSAVSKAKKHKIIGEEEYAKISHKFSEYSSS